MEDPHRFGQWGQTSEEILRKQFPLHRACRDGDLEALSLLLVEAQHGIYEEDNFYGWTPAHWAAYFGKLNCLMRLLEVGLDVDVSSIRLNQTSMHIAAFAGRSHNVKWLLHCGAKIDRQLACLRKLMTTTRVGVNCNIRTSRFRQTPVHLAAFGGHPQCLLWLVSASAELDNQDYLGETAIHKAARTGSMECISLLVSHGARLYVKNNTGQTAADLSKNCGHAEVSRYLEQAGQTQQSEVGGIYNQSPSPHAITTPSPHDVTSRGLNAGCLPPAGPQGDAPLVDCPMEEEESVTRTATADGPVTDVTTHSGVSANVVSVGGRKRCREDNDDIDHKRRRSDFAMGFNGVMSNDPINGLHQGMSWYNKHSVVMADNGGTPTETINGDSNHHRLSTESIDYCIGYDYNGIPQDVPVPETPMSNEYVMSEQAWRIVNGHVGPSQSHTTWPSTCPYTANTPSQPQPPFIQNPLTSGHHPVIHNGLVVQNKVNSVNGHGHPLQPTSSVCEHTDSVMVEQGYDSILHDSLMNGIH